MKELFEKFPHCSMSECQGKVLIDTCSFFYIFSHNEKIKTFSKLKNKALTSFNVEEIIHVLHKLHHEKQLIRKYLHKALEDDFVIIDVPVNPGEREKEKEFVNSIDNELLQHCADPSDAVLMAAAIKTKSSILTKDKHHLFTSDLNNFIRKYNINIKKEIKDFLN